MKFAKLITVILILTILSIFSGMVSWPFQFTFVGLIYLISIYTLLVRKKLNKTFFSVVILVLPFVLVYGYVSINNFMKLGHIHSFPIFIIPIFSALMAYFCYSKKQGLTYIAVLVFFIIVMGTIGMPNWINFAFDDENPINMEFPSIVLEDINDYPINLAKDKVTVIDLWSTSCAVCIKNFPNFDRFSQKYKDDNEVEFYTLNLPLKRDKMLDVKSYVKDYKFKSIFAKEISSWNSLKNKSVPKLLIINKDKQIVYKGKMNDKWYEFYNSTDRLIQKYKNE